MTLLLRPTPGTYKNMGCMKHPGSGGRRLVSHVEQPLAVVVTRGLLTSYNRGSL